MRTLHDRRSLVCTVALALGACDDDRYAEVAALCEGDAAVQLLPHASARIGEVTPARDATMLYLEEHDSHMATYVGRGCGVDPVRVADGARMRVARVHLDPADNDPGLGCMVGEDRFFRLDLRGQSPPTLLLPRYSCVFATPSAHGVLVQTDLHGNAVPGWWLFPEFPAETGGIELGLTYRPQVNADSFFLNVGDVLHVYDPKARAKLPLLPDVDGYRVNDTHVLWRASSLEETAPMHLLELASGARVRLGDFDPAIDTPSPGTFATDHSSWNFDHDGAHVLHVPTDPDALGEAYDLRGKPLSLPLSGAVIASLPGGHVVTYHQEAAALYTARPGDESAIRLDLAPTRDTRWQITAVDDHLETVEAGALQEVPLDGGPARVLVQDVDLNRHWLGPHLVTIFADDLTSIDRRSGARTVHASHAAALVPAPDGAGVYFRVSGAPDGSQDGLWYLPATALRP
jgi:hypothetical protein